MNSWSLPWKQCDYSRGLYWFDLSLNDWLMLTQTDEVPNHLSSQWRRLSVGSPPAVREAWGVPIFIAWLRLSNHKRLKLKQETPENEFCRWCSTCPLILPALLMTLIWARKKSFLEILGVFDFDFDLLILQ